jgi:hypothetical protein
MASPVRQTRHGRVPSNSVDPGHGGTSTMHGGRRGGNNVEQWKDVWKVTGVASTPQVAFSLFRGPRPAACPARLELVDSNFFVCSTDSLTAVHRSRHHSCRIGAQLRWFCFLCYAVTIRTINLAGGVRQ